MKNLLSFLLIIFSIGVFSQSLEPNEINNIDKYIYNLNVSGKYSVWRKTHNGNTDKITRPFIICEGFDPVNSWSGKDVYRYQMNVGFMSCLRNRGYDIIILDLDNNTVSIEHNAELLIKLIKEINQKVADNGSKNRIIVGGVSMGGLIAKYALAKMEHDGEDHKADRFITFDSPHRGANVPLGYQHFADTWLHPVLELENYSADMESIGINPIQFFTNNFANKFGMLFMQTSAMEMSANYYKANELRESYLIKSALNGSYPKKTRNIAVANGANTTGQGFNEGDKLLELTSGTCLIDEDIPVSIFGYNLGTVHLRWCPWAISHRVYAMPGDLFGRDYTLTIGHQLEVNGVSTNFPAIARSSLEHDYLTPPYNYIMDNVPGSYYELSPLRDLEEGLQQGIDIPLKWKQKFCIRTPFGRYCKTITLINTTVNVPFHKIFGQLNSETDYKFTFVPTLSALDIHKDDWYYDISQIPYYPYPRDKSITIFDAVFASEQNSYHAILNDDIVIDNLIDEIAPSDLYIQNKTYESNYKNTFIAKNIIVGKNVDTKPNRTPVGNVLIENGADIDFIASQGIDLKDGFTSNGDSDFRIDNTLNYTPCNNYKVNKCKNYVQDNDIIYNNNIDSLKFETYISVEGMNDSYNNNTNNLSQNLITIYPNPTKGKLKVTSTQNTISQITITNVSGITVFNKQANQKELEINISNLQNGVYFVKVITEQGSVFTEKIVKE